MGCVVYRLCWEVEEEISTGITGVYTNNLRTNKGMCEDGQVKV